MAISNSTQLTIDGITGQTQNASMPWSLNQLDANTYEFSVHSGDHWTNVPGGWNDVTSGGGAERDEIGFSQLYAEGTQINLSETITIQPGPTNTASWLDLTQLHSTTNSPPSPFVLGLDRSDHLQVILQNPSDGNLYVYTSPNPVVRGQPMDVDIQAKMGPSGGGYVGVWLDGTQIVNYHGAVGATNSEYSWKLGVYRGPAAETMTATFSNIDFSTGPLSAPTAPTQPTTPTIPPTSTTPTSPATPTTPTTPTAPTSSVTRPVLTVADDSLWVAGRGGTVDLGTKVTTTDSNDRVALHITGLPNYESITDTLDGQTFRGRDITLTAAQVNSGLTLTSTYRGGGHPVAELTLTATATDPSTGAVATASPQTITVTDPRPGATTTTTSQQTTTATDPSATGLTQHHAAHHDCAGHGSALLSQIREMLAGGVANSAPQWIAATDQPSATGTTTASLASQSFALLNQYLAGHTGRADPGQMVAALSNGTAWHQDSLLTRPHH